MTDTTSTRDDQDDFYDDAEDVFPGKEDLKDRLVAIFALENGQDKNAEGKHYPYVKTLTVVLDDGPSGYQATAVRDGEAGPNRVPSVADEGPQELALRWSTSGLVSRLQPRVGKTFKPLVGRVNSQPNKTKGRSASWSISKPTEDDRPIARPYNGLLRSIADRLEKEQTAAETKAAFDE